MSKRLANGFLFAPSRLQAFGDYIRRSTKPQTPLAARESFSIKRDGLVPSLIAALNRSCCPSTIARLVVPVDVDSVYGSSVRALTHVSNKVLKLSPRFTYGNTSPAVVCKTRVVAIKASLNHRHPTVVGGCSKHSMLSARLSMNTPAGFCVSALKCISGNNSRSAARTMTKPSSMFFVGVDVLNSRKSAKGLTGKVFESCHFVTSKLITVKKAWQAAVIQLFGSYPSQAGAFYHG